MYIISSRQSLIDKLSELKKQGLSVGFVPTMGALHQGHIQLIRIAKEENDLVVCSIFVNPLQFNNQVDFNKYPITLEEDKKHLKSVGCDILFLPSRKDIFPNEPNLDYQFSELSDVMEGVYRPGHFKGMAAVIEAFFRLILPNKAYFGEKDYQQLAIIKWLVIEKGFNIEIVPCKTVRNEHGLALSSRNLRLSKEELLLASNLYKMMLFCKANKKYSPKKLITLARNQLHSDFKVEYILFVDESTLKPVNSWSESLAPRVFVAASLSGVRLIDNLSLID